MAESPPIAIEVVVLPPSVYGLGTYTFPVTDLPMGYTRAELIIDRTQWLDPSSQLAWQADVSMDGGSTWNQSPQTGAAATVNGGVKFYQGGPQQGQVRTTSSFSMGLLNPDEPDRAVRGSFTVTVAAAEISAKARLT